MKPSCQREDTPLGRWLMTVLQPAGSVDKLTTHARFSRRPWPEQAPSFKRVLTRDTGTQQETTALEPRRDSGTAFRLYLSTLSDVKPARPWQDYTTRELSSERRTSSLSSTTQGITTSADDEQSSSVPTRHKVCSSPKRQEKKGQ